MLAYSRAVGLIDASAGIGTSDTGGVTTGPRSLVTSDLVSLNNSYAMAQANRVAAQQHWQTSAHTPLLSLPEVIGNPTYTALVQARSAAQAAYQQDSQRHRADFPALQQLGAQIVSYDRQITRLAGAIRDSIRDQYQTAQAQETALAGQVNQLKAATLSEQDKSVRYNILKRETDTNRTMYDGLLQRYKELSAQAGVSANNVSMVDTAALPTHPVSPKPLLNFAAAAMLGLLLASAAVFLLEKFDDAVRSPDDVPQKLGLALLNTVPLLKADQTPREALDDPRSPLSESYAALRTSLELAHSGGLPSILLFTSSRPGEGKSTSAYAVARDFARIGKNVVLIDSDLRRPSLHRVFGLLNKHGLTSVLARYRTLDEVIQPTGVDRLSFLSTGPLPPNPAELLSGVSLKATLADLRKRFDLIVIDSPPVLGLADAIILASNADGVVFVTEANAPHHGQAKAALKRLKAGQSNILGAVLTKYDAKKVGYNYDYGYYAYSYGQDHDAAK
jgi:succinoglycan biosynthesis transport protein ExoP